MPPVISPTTVSTDRSSLRTCRERLGHALGLYVTGDISTLADSFEAERYVISTALQSDAASPTRFDGMFVFIRDGDEAGEVRRVVNGSYDGPIGALMVDRPFDSILQLGATFEVSVLPVERYQGVGSLNEAINEGLETLPVITILPLTSDGTQRVSLENYDWPIKSIGAIYDPLTNADDPLRQSSVRGVLQFDGDTPYIQLSSAFNSGDVFYAGVQRPATTWIGTGDPTSWATTATGLVDDTDECLYTAKVVTAAAMPFAKSKYALTYPMGSKERSELMGEMEDAEVRAAFSSWHNRPRGSGVQRVRPTSGGRGTWWENL